jgi:hypothetical protein
MNPNNAASAALPWPARLQKQYEFVTCAEEVLSEQRAEFERTLAEFLQAQETTSGGDETQVAELRKQNEALRLLLQCQSGAADSAPGGDARVDVDDLRRQLELKQAEIDELRASRLPTANPSGEDRDIEAYEVELNEFRRQLEADRQKLNEELVQLRARNAELNDAAREAELELSKERAQMARERIELERIRTEIRQETEHSNRNQAVHERMAMLQTRKGEAVERRPPEKPVAPNGNGHADARENGSRAGLWRSLISLATDDERP